MTTKKSRTITLTLDPKQANDLRILLNKNRPGALFGGLTEAWLLTVPALIDEVSAGLDAIEAARHPEGRPDGLYPDAVSRLYQLARRTGCPAEAILTLLHGIPHERAEGRKWVRTLIECAPTEDEARTWVQTPPTAEEASALAALRR